MSRAVFDSSAILKIYYDEPGKKKVLQLLDRHEPLISAVNLCEVFTKLIEDDLDIDNIKETFDGLDIQVVNFAEKHAMKAAEIRPFTKKLGLSLGDRSCLALAALENAVAVTADKSWAGLRFGKIEVIR